MTGMEPEGHPGSALPRREPLARADRIQIAMLAGLFAMLAAMLGAGAVGFTTLSGQILGLQKQVGDLRTEVHEEIGGLRIEMQKEIGDLSGRITRVETLIQTHLVPRSAIPPAARR